MRSGPGTPPYPYRCTDLSACQSSIGAVVSRHALRRCCYYCSTAIDATREAIIGSFVKDLLSVSKAEEAASYSYPLSCLNKQLLTAVSAMTVITGHGQRFNDAA